MSLASISATRRKASEWNKFPTLDGTFLRWRRRSFWSHDLMDSSGGAALCSVQKLPFKRMTLALHGRRCQLRPRDGSAPPAWDLVDASGHKLLSVTGNPVWQQDDPVLRLQGGEQIVFSVNTRFPSRAVMSCTSLRTNTVIARIRWRSRSWWRPLSTIEIMVTPKFAMTESVVALLMLASVDYLPQCFNYQAPGGGM